MKKYLVSFLLVASFTAHAVNPFRTFFDECSKPQWYGLSNLQTGASALLKPVQNFTLPFAQKVTECATSISTSVMNNPWVAFTAASSMSLFKKVPSLLSPLYANHEGALAGGVAGLFIARSLSAQFGTHSTIVKYKQEDGFVKNIKQNDFLDNISSGLHFGLGIYGLYAGAHSLKTQKDIGLTLLASGLLFSLTEKLKAKTVEYIKLEAAYQNQFDLRLKWKKQAEQGSEDVGRYLDENEELRKKLKKLDEENTKLHINLVAQDVVSRVMSSALSEIYQRDLVSLFYELSLMKSADDIIKDFQTLKITELEEKNRALQDVIAEINTIDDSNLDWTRNWEESFDVSGLIGKHVSSTPVKDGNR